MLIVHNYSKYTEIRLMDLTLMVLKPTAELSIFQLSSYTVLLLLLSQFNAYYIS